MRCKYALLNKIIALFYKQVTFSSQKTLTKFVEMVALRYLHLTTQCGVGNEVPQLPQT